MKFQTMKKVTALVITVIMLLAAVSATAGTAEEKLNTYYKLVSGYMTANNFEKAMENLEKALQYCDEETNPDIYADLYVKKGWILANQHDYENGLTALDEALRVDPELSNAYLVKSAIFSETGEDEKADETYEKYLELQQVEGTAKIFLSATTKMNAERYAEAAEEFVTILDDAEYGSASAYNAGTCYLKIKEYEKAAEVFETILNDAEYGNISAYSAGTCYMEMTEYEKALAYFAKYPESEPQPDDLQYNIAFCSMKLNKLDEAIESFTVSIETEPYKAAAHYWRGLTALTRTGDETLEAEKSAELMKMAADDFTAYLEAATEAARAEAEEGAEVPEVVDDATYYRGACYLALNEFEKAEADFDACISNGLLTGECSYYRGVACLNLGKYEKAEADFDTSISQGLYLDESTYNRGVARVNLGKFAEAMEDLTASIEKGINTIDALKCRAIASNGLGDYQAAIDDLTVLIEQGQGVDLYTVYQMRAQVYQNSGDEVHYLEDLETSLEYLDSTEDAEQ